MAMTTMRLGLLLIVALTIIQISKGEKEDESQMEQKSEGNMMASSMEEVELRTVREAGKKKNKKCGPKCRRKGRSNKKKRCNKKKCKRERKNNKKGKKKGGKKRTIKPTKKGKKEKKQGKKEKEDLKKKKRTKKFKKKPNISVRQTCDEAALCQKIKDYIKYSNQLRKVKRIVKSCDTMEKKANKSATEFDATVAALDEVIASNAKRRLYIRWRRTQRSTDEVVAIRDNLKNCSVSAKAKCEKKVEPACLETALHTECEASLQAWLNSFGPSKGSCLQASADCCACITALPTVDAKCLDFDTKSTNAVASKKKCTGGTETGSFGFCRKQQQEASVKGPPAACGGSTATKAPPSATTAAGATTAAPAGSVECETRKGSRQCSSTCSSYSSKYDSSYECNSCGNPVCSTWRDTCCCQIGTKICAQEVCTEGSECYTPPSGFTTAAPDSESKTTPAPPSTTSSTVPTPGNSSTTCATLFPNSTVIDDYQKCTDCTLGTKCQKWQDACCCVRGNNSCLGNSCTKANVCAGETPECNSLIEKFSSKTCEDCSIGSDCQKWRDTCCCRVRNKYCMQPQCTNMSTCVSLDTPLLPCTTIFPNPDNKMKCDDCKNSTCVRWRDTCCCKVGTRYCEQDKCVEGAVCNKGQNPYELFGLEDHQGKDLNGQKNY